MIIFGTRGKLLKTEPVVATCPNCKVDGQIFMSVYQRWAHIFWVPTFPIGKPGASVCANCRQVLQHKEMPPELRMSYDNVKAATPTPFWTFSGLIVIALIFIAAAIAGTQKAKKVTSMIPALKQNDLLHIKMTDDRFTLAKVSRVKGDSVFVNANTFESTAETGLDDLKSKPYNQEEELFTVADLKDMDKKELILDIERE